MRYIILAIAFAATYQIDYAAEALLIIISTLSLIYYTLVFRVMSGLNKSILGETDTINLQKLTLNILTNIFAVVVLIMQTPYGDIGWASVPWITVTFAMTILGWLINFNLVTYTKKDD